MTTIVFAQIPAGILTTPPPTGVGSANFAIAGVGYEDLTALGGAGLGVFYLQTTDGSGPPSPSFGIGDGTLQLVSGYCFGAGIMDAGAGSGSFVLDGWGYESPNYGRGQLVLYGFAFAPGGEPTSSDSFPRISMQDAVSGADDISALRIAVMQATLALAAQSSTQFTGTRSLHDAVSFDAGLAAVYHQLLTVSLAMGCAQTISYRAIGEMHDALILGGVVSGSREAHNLILDALVFGALLDHFEHNDITSSVAFSMHVTQTYTAMAALLDTLMVDDEMPGTATLAAAIADGMHVGAAGVYSLEAHSVLIDNLDFVLSLSIDNFEYVAFAVNAESKGISRYTNYPFNSFMRVGSRYYGATDTGLYVLNGPDDAGVPIAAAFRLGMSALGERVLKQVPSAYIGYSATGDLLLKAVIASPIDGLREAHCYRLKAAKAANIREGRVLIGPGIKSVYWDFVIENINGAQFAIDALDLHPIMLTRRVRGNSGGTR